ncbi:hypothetical protein LSAT2_026330 [Lamellibrachia satsuma]|nr:hypothetical protein LSAT2_026330 [Lamellibrachia satsuma]
MVRTLNNIDVPPERGDITKELVWPFDVGYGKIRARRYEQLLATLPQARPGPAVCRPRPGPARPGPARSRRAGPGLDPKLGPRRALIDKLELIQRRATKLIPELRELGYESCLKESKSKGQGAWGGGTTSLWMAQGSPTDMVVDRHRDDSCQTYKPSSRTFLDASAEVCPEVE